MTDQSTRDQWTLSTRTLERTDPNWTEPESSTQDGAAPDLAVADRSAEDGPVYHSAGAEHPDFERADPEHAVGVAPMPDADPQAAHEHDSVAAAPDPGEPVDLDEAGDVTGGEAPDVETSADDTAAPDVASSGELLPGDVPVEPVALFDGAMTERFRDRWQQLQLRFIDDPNTVATQAGALADEMVAGPAADH